MFNEDLLIHEVVDFLSHRFNLEMEADEHTGDIRVDTNQFNFTGHWVNKLDYLIRLAEKMAGVIAKEYDIYMDYEMECDELILKILF